MYINDIVRDIGSNIRLFTEDISLPVTAADSLNTDLNKISQWAATRPRGYKTFFVLNSIEHEILNAHKYKNIKKFGFFLGSDKPRMLFFTAQKC